MRYEFERDGRHVASVLWEGPGQVEVEVADPSDRPRFDRTDRRDCSLVRLGWLWLQRQLADDKPVPLLFRLSETGWLARGTH